MTVGPSKHFTTLPPDQAIRVAFLAGWAGAMAQHYPAGFRIPCVDPEHARDLPFVVPFVAEFGRAWRIVWLEETIVLAVAERPA